MSSTKGVMELKYIGGDLERRKDITPEHLVRCPYDFRHEMKLKNLTKHVELCREDWFIRCRKYGIEPVKNRCCCCHVEYWVYEKAFHNLHCLSLGYPLPKPEKSAKALREEEIDRMDREFVWKCYWNWFGCDTTNFKLDPDL